MGHDILSAINFNEQEDVPTEMQAYDEENQLMNTKTIHHHHKSTNLFKEQDQEQDQIVSQSKHIKINSIEDIGNLAVTDNRFSFGPSKFQHNKEMVTSILQRFTAKRIQQEFEEDLKDFKNC